MWDINKTSQYLMLFYSAFIVMIYFKFSGFLRHLITKNVINKLRKNEKSKMHVSVFFLLMMQHAVVSEVYI